MQDFILSELGYAFDVSIKRIEECRTANEMNLVDESFTTLVAFAENLAHKSRKDDYLFYADIRDMLKEKEEAFQTAYAYKENELMEKQ